MFDTPILFLIFNRLDTSKQVFAEIKKQKPKYLFIAADGARSLKEGEKECCEQVRAYVLENIDWECEIKTLFRDENLGCGKAVSQAITWFFKNVEMGIILEDDCLPSISFFMYCEKLLHYYKNDERIYHIAGNNPLKNSSNKSKEYYFAKVQHCWGWASWARAWKKYTFDIQDYDYFCQNQLISIFKTKPEQNYWKSIFQKMCNHEIDTWDYQWTYSILQNKGICINPCKNMISNIGFAGDGTHTFGVDSSFSNQVRYEVDLIIYPQKIRYNEKLCRLISEQAFLIPEITFYSKCKKLYTTLVIKNIKIFLKKIGIFNKVKSIINGNQNTSQ